MIGPYILASHCPNERMADKCPKARQLVQRVYAEPLANIIISYYAPNSDDHKVIGRHGAYERLFDERGIATMAWDELFVSACEMGYPDIVKALLRKRPVPLNASNIVCTGAAAAAQNDHSCIIDLLLLQPYIIHMESIVYIACLNGSTNV